MANLVETSRWESGIYQFETSDPVMGGPNGIDNRPTRELANRTLWLKNELAKAVESIGNNQKSTDAALLLKVDNTTTITAGNGLAGGGNLTQSRTITLGTPSKITSSTTNTVSAASHTHEIDKASTEVAGVVQLSSDTDSTSVNMAATPAAVRAAMQAASQATATGTIAYFAGDSAPAGWLKANGAQVSRSVYADLFAAISTRFGAGNGSTTFTLPDLRGVFLRGFDDGRGFDGGRVLGSLQNHNLAEHRHATGWRINNTGNEFALVRNNWSGEVAVTANVSSENVAVIPGDAESYSQAAGISHAATNDRYATSRAYYDAQGETRPTNVALLACIKI